LGRDLSAAGGRPKIAPAGADLVEFALQGRETHGVAGLLSLYGIESPGLISCLALADRVAELIGDSAGTWACPSRT